MHLSRTLLVYLVRRQLMTKISIPTTTKCGAFGLSTSPYTTHAQPVGTFDGDGANVNAANENVVLPTNEGIARYRDAVRAVGIAQAELLLTETT